LRWRKERGIKMDYKSIIVELLDKVSDDTLKRVYRLLEYLYVREK
jgi:hypothetical protein